MNHPAYTRYPDLKTKTEPQYTEWKKVFAWIPKTTLGGKKIWMKSIYTRNVVIEWTPPTYPAGPYSKKQFATWDEILNIKMSEI